MQPAAPELLVALSTVLDRWGRWYLFAQAVVAYGVPRVSADVDVTVALASDDPRFARDIKLRIDDPEFPRRTRVLPHRTRQEPMSRNRLRHRLIERFDSG